MKRRPLIAGNWKMNKTPGESQAFIEQFLPASVRFPDCDVLLIPPFTSLDRVGRMLLASTLLLGAQDVHFETSGAFTGAVSADMVSACGCTHVLAGHSERRHVFGDSIDMVNRKVGAILKSGLQAILCVGETLDERRSDRTHAVLEAQLNGGLAGVDAAAFGRVVIAYEPVWAIGTGVTATQEQAQSTIGWIRAWAKTKYAASASEALRILYGGSVTPENACLLLSQPDIDGALVGGASLDSDSFARILDVAQALQEDGTPC